MPLKMYSQDNSKKEPTIKNIIAVAAGKGGVGKSTVTANLARALQKLGHKIGVMDTDIYGPSIRKMMPEDRLPNQNGNIISPAICDGIRMISMAYFRKANEAAAVRAPIANGIISQFIKSVDWGPLDYLLIDFPPGTGDIQLTLSQQASLTGAIMVTTPQEVAVMDVRKAMHLFEQVHVPIIGIVENMSYYLHPQSNEKCYLFGKGGGEQLAREAGVPFLGSIPIDSTICSCGDAGKSIFNQETPAASQYIELAHQVVAHTDILTAQSKNSMKGFELAWKEMGSS